MKTQLLTLMGVFFLSACAVARSDSPAPLTNAPTQESNAMTTSSPPSSSEEPPRSQANADVLFVRAVLQDDGRWTFYVTVAHPDTGWEDYADGWDVIAPDGTVLKANPGDPFTRLLLHPHVEEQPFTRSQGNISIPPQVTQVRVRAHDLIAGFGGQEVEVNLMQPSGPNFEVQR